MRRVVSLYLPTWPTDRIRRKFGDPPRDKPLVTVATEGSRRLLVGVDQAAHALGLRRGQTLTHAQALVPDLHVIDATPEEDEASLLDLARWCIGYSPIVAPDPPDGIWIDIAGSAHLFGGEEALVDDVMKRLTAQGIQAMACVADAPGAAWAVARFSIMNVVPPGRSVDAVATLPVAALRLPSKTVEALHRLGVERVGQLASMPRGPMVRRFGRETALRLDQAFGHVFEPLNPLMPKELPSKRLVFADPIGRLEDLQDVVRRLADALCQTLEKTAQGVRRLDLIVERVDKRSIALRVGTAKATRDAKHLAKLFDERLQTIDPGFGIDAVTLFASKIEPLNEQQMQARGVGGEGENDVDLSHLVDRLGARLGTRRIYRLAPVESHLPERSMRQISPLAPPTGQTWPEILPRPTRLIDPPEPVTATALLPDHPPKFFVWRKIRHRVVHADGPERITGEWWRSDKERTLLRDYYRVEDEKGGRFWIFRDAPADQGGRWWLHGLFA
ncbi:DNA polymerase Y family protein [Microvirga rosea]|uniref:DNA polymerase Y family protein n=1 Tax=Microvirga rosea TaxID=2715425 RepID=UPI001D09C385|nr:DNA polymerase Y family protein [Microvirga rosea]MCB8822492.1 DNA polymerase Y family protein [Microvirga rosea]